MSGFSKMFEGISAESVDPQIVILCRKYPFSVDVQKVIAQYKGSETEEERKVFREVLLHYVSEPVLNYLDRQEVGQ